MKKIITYVLFVLFSLDASAQNNSPYQPDYQNKEYEKVVETAMQQLKLNPKDSLAHYFMAFSYAHLKDYKSAIEHFEVVKNTDLKGPYILLWLAKSYAAENQTEKALKELESLDSLQACFTSQLNNSAFDSLKENERFKTISANMYQRANPCKFDINYRKFDFWIGEWDVYSNGKKIAESSITNTNGDCGILENWRPIGSNGGNSISYYDSTDKKWKQNWVANGSVSHYEEAKNYVNGDMQLIAKGNGVWYRMIYTRDMIDDTVRQVMESSSDKGETWSKVFDGLYKRKK